MKPNFALSLSMDGICLMQRVTDGWHLVGEVPLDVADLPAALADLRARARDLEPGVMSTKILIPNEQIRYIALDTTRADEEDVRDALTDATPYALDELTYDYVKGGGRTYIAAVANETLIEAREFAREHRFNPVSFAAVPEPFTFVGEAFFGAAGSTEVERDDVAVTITGVLPVAESQPTPQPPIVTEQADPPAQTDSTAETLDDAFSDAEEAEADRFEPDRAEADPEPVAEAPEAEEEAPLRLDVPASEDVAEEAPQDTPTEDPAELLVPRDQGVVSVEETDPLPEPEQPEEETEPQPPLTPVLTATPEPRPKGDSAGAEEGEFIFASRVRAVRERGRTPGAAAPRQEPSLGRAAAADLSVPTGTGTDPMPLVAAPSRSTPADSAAPSLSREATPPEIVPQITGDAADAVPLEDAKATRPMPVAAPVITADAPAAKQALPDAATAPRANAVAEDSLVADPEAPAPGPRAEQRNVFGGRSSDKPVVGGKPRFLGLILTAILLLFLLAVAAFAAMSTETVARWFGFGTSETEVVEATPEAEEPAPEPVAVAAVSQEAPALPPTPASPPEAEPAPVEEPEPEPQTAEVAPEQEPTPPVAAIAAPLGQVLTPEEAQRIYAATGVWQKAPRMPLEPRAETLGDFAVATAPRPVVQVAARPLSDAGQTTGDAVIATMVDPPAPSTTFNFDQNGRVVATPEGATTPDGVLVIAGRPPLNPPTRPGTVAPVISPQELLSSVIPEEANPATDAPEGVLLIAGRPTVTPPIRPGTVAPVAPAEVTSPEGATPLPDAPDGVRLIAGRPAVTPPVRPGTVAPAATAEVTPPEVATPLPEAPEGVRLIAGPPPVQPPARPVASPPEQNATPAPLLQEDGLLVIAGAPAVLPPVRPGTVAPSVTSVAPMAEEPASTEGAADTVVPEGAIARAPTTAPLAPAPEGVNLIAGAPPVLPPARPGTVAPDQEAALTGLTQEVAAALATEAPGTAQRPGADTARPLPRPAAVIQAAAARANTPILGALTRSEAAGFRPRTRPAGLAPAPAADPAPAEEPAQQEATAPTGLQLSAEIAAAVEAANNRPNPYINPTAAAVTASLRPDQRPRNMARIVSRAEAAQERAAAQVAAARPAAVAPSGPTAGSVAQAATVDNALNLREINLIGIYGGSNDRRALVRLSNGNFVRVTVGDRLDGGRVTAISDGALSYTRRGRAVTLQVPG